MSWSRRRHGRAGYHHGNLREALIDATLALIADNGASGFTFAEAARQAGVSPAAPYRHFRDRDQLLVEVATQGFARFEASLTAAWNKGAPDPIAALCALGKAYLHFARTQPGYYGAMFEAGVPPAATPELRDASDRAFAVLRAAAEVAIARLAPDRRPPALMAALHIWSLAHGVASLFEERHGVKRTLPMSADDLLEAGVLVYLRGLGLTD
ncbi:MAG: TetR/AcrR family transcriptional regulator [Hyphomicrobiales bacterium]|nr:TetR/AcrR family transcriptional regulator [Hyphomicrobiales bacterium]